MTTALKKARKTFWLWFAIFALSFILAYVLKKFLHLHDFIQADNFIFTIVPVIFIACIIIAYGLHDKYAKTAKKSESTEKKNDLYLKAIALKTAFLSIGGTVVNLMLILHWKTDYLYLSAMAAVFILLAYPTQVKYDMNFTKKYDISEQPPEQQEHHESENTQEHKKSRP